MRKIFLSILLSVNCLFVCAQGLSCGDAIPMDNETRLNLAPGSYWWTCETFDLPLTVYFVPAAATDPAPVAYVDFGCPSGYSDDPKVMNLLQNSWNGHLPRKLAVDTIYNVDGTPVYKIFYGREQLKLLKAYGIDYSIPAYVRVDLASPGEGRVGNHEMGTDCAVTSATIRQNQPQNIDSTISTFKAYLADMYDIETIQLRLDVDSVDSLKLVSDTPRVYVMSVCDSVLDAAILLDSLTLTYDEDSASYYGWITENQVRDWRIKDSDGEVFLRLQLDSAIHGQLNWKEYIFVPTCNNQSVRIQESDTVHVEARQTQLSYKIDAEQWQSYAHKLVWTGDTLVRIYFSDTCHYSMVKTNIHVGYYVELAGGDSTVVGTNEMMQLAFSYADTNGNVYVKVRSDRQGDLITSVTSDPIPTSVMRKSEESDVLPQRLVMENGRIYIVYGDKKYTILGEQIR